MGQGKLRIPLLLHHFNSSFPCLFHLCFSSHITDMVWILSLLNGLCVTLSSDAQKLTYHFCLPKLYRTVLCMQNIAYGVQRSLESTLCLVSRLAWQCPPSPPPPTHCLILQFLLGLPSPEAFVLPGMTFLPNHPVGFSSHSTFFIRLSQIQTSSSPPPN